MKKSADNNHILYSEEGNRIGQNYTEDNNINTYDFDLEESDFDFFLDLPMYRKMRKSKIMEMNIKKTLIALFVLLAASALILWLTDSYWTVGFAVIFLWIFIDQHFD